MIYFCIPTFNEERTVGVVLWKLRQVMAELQRDYQIIVVDDASTDSTPAVLSPYIRVLPLTVIRNSERRGYADSLELAIREAVRRSPYPKRDAVITLQADFTEDPDVVTTLVKRFEAGADVVATNATMEAEAPRALRWGRRFLKWLLRKHEWAGLADPLSGLRAYRVVVLKRALETRGNARLLSWPGVGANVELLALTVPLSRRNDAVDTTLLLHRLQRETRFTFMSALREVRGAATGKVNAHAQPLPTDSRIATPLPIAAEPRRERVSGRGERPSGRGRERASGRTGERPKRGERGERGERPERAERPKRTREPEQREKRREKPQRAQPVLEEAVPPVAAAAGAAEQGAKKKRKRRRRKKRPAEQQAGATQLELAVEQTETPVAASEEAGAPVAEAGAPAKKKSRRGRRGGRGRRRGPRNAAGEPSNGGESSEANENHDNSGDQGGEAPPPIAVEGD